MSPLAGKRILIVEDEFLIALMAADIVQELGAIPVGPAHTLDAGVRLAGSAGLDGALLDVNLKGQKSDAIARLLAARGLPFVLVTGQSANGDAQTGIPRLEKPFSTETLARALEALFEPAA